MACVRGLILMLLLLQNKRQWDYIIAKDFNGKFVKSPTTHYLYGHPMMAAPYLNNYSTLQPSRLTIKSIHGSHAPKGEEKLNLRTRYPSFSFSIIAFIRSWIWLGRHRSIFPLGYWALIFVLVFSYSIKMSKARDWNPPHLHPQRWVNVMENVYLFLSGYINFMIRC